MEAGSIDAVKSDLNKKTYSIRCRLCRTQLLVSDKIRFFHSGSKESCGNCLFLEEESLPEWIQGEIENALWTKSRLKCPRGQCTARVGGFDFVQGLLCGCGEFITPAIWIQDGKVDVRVINSDDVMSTSPQSSMSGYQSGSRHATKTVHKSSFPQVVACTSGVSGVTTTGEALSKPCQGIFDQAVGGETGEIGFAQSGHHSYVDNINIADIVTMARLPTTIPLTKSRRMRIKTHQLNHSEIEASPEKPTNHTDITKPVELVTKVSSNRFNPLPVEEPETLKSPHNTSLHKACTQDHLICAICLDYFYKPYKCPCDHVFCKSCLRQLYHNRAGNLKCPICRNPVKYIELANDVREEIHKLQDPALKQREAFENKARYRKWPLPPIGPLPFLRKRQTLVPSQDKNLIKMAAVLLLVVCYTILYILH